MTTAKTILIINGPNLNMLGKREAGHYGTATLADLEAYCAARAETHGLACRFFQSNDEGAIIETIHAAHGEAPAGLIINAGGFTHTSVAIRDALAMLDIPVVETHISNTHAREEFRHQSFITGVATGVIAGFGLQSYGLAIDAIAAIIGAGDDNRRKE